jgi:hypothetical protein
VQNLRASSDKTRHPLTSPRPSKPCPSHSSGILNSSTDSQQFLRPHGYYSNLYTSRSSPNMLKRKADHDHVARLAKIAKTTKEPTKPAKIYETDLERIIGQGQELVINALKLCQRFERQKLGRRARVAKDEINQKEIQRINQEIKAVNVC